ncbi:MAG: sensor histidine kinase [Anaerolineales bacterium]
MRIVESVASQASLLIENHRLYREVEYRAGLAERARLAREIHDGLAQTLGYLKLRMNQVARWLEEGATERSEAAFAEIKEQLNDAYIDARQAIDGPRVDPTQASLEDWLTDLYKEFEELSQIRVEANPTPDIDLPSEVASQLLRIIQEALGNIRKHASASLARIEWNLDDHWVLLRIRDDGCGFEPDSVPAISRHGLRIMKERAELLGADFQLSSRPGDGTSITVRLPLKTLDKRQLYG